MKRGPFGGFVVAFGGADALGGRTMGHDGLRTDSM
jgi:hypothetical protein